jgi:hypothetical protein
VQLFTGGLGPPLSHAVRIHNPQSLAVAMSLARQIKQMELSTSASTNVVRHDILRTPPPRLPAATADRVATPLATVVGQSVKRLSRPEQEERRRLGLCFNCDERYTWGHNRTYKRLFYVHGVDIDDSDDTIEAETPVFSLHALAGVHFSDTMQVTVKLGPSPLLALLDSVHGVDIDDSDDTIEAETPVFSLHALAGVRFSNTMQVTVKLGASPLLALLDSGSTHDFISESAARRTGLPLQSRSRLTTTVANGKCVTCVGVLRQVEFSIHGATFHADLFVMLLAGFDMVLGTRWLAMLGPVLWDFGARKLMFYRQGQPIYVTIRIGRATRVLRRCLLRTAGAPTDTLPRPRHHSRPRLGAGRGAPLPLPSVPQG